MNRSRRLTKQAREHIELIMRNNSEMSTDEAMEIVEPHFMFDPQTAKRTEIRRTVHRIMRAIKGETGKRVCFNLRDDDASFYVNIETTLSIDALDGVEKQLDGQFYGLRESKNRIAKRRLFLKSRQVTPPEEGKD